MTAINIPVIWRSKYRAEPYRTVITINVSDSEMPDITPYVEPLVYDIGSSTLISNGETYNYIAPYTIYGFNPQTGKLAVLYASQTPNERWSYTASDGTSGGNPISSAYTFKGLTVYYSIGQTSWEDPTPQGNVNIVNGDQSNNLNKVAWMAVYAQKNN